MKQRTGRIRENHAGSLCLLDECPVKPEFSIGSIFCCGMCEFYEGREKLPADNGWDVRVKCSADEAKPIQPLLEEVES